MEDFWEEFPIFLNAMVIGGNCLLEHRQGRHNNDFLKSKPLYSSFEAFFIDSGIPKEKIMNTF
jgi:hypothetical protein